MLWRQRYLLWGSQQRKLLVIFNSHCDVSRLFTSDAAPSATGGLSFENIFNDENKRRAQQKLKVERPIRTAKEYPLTPDHSYAAVLVPLCTVKGEPSLLLTLRSSRLTKHRGEVSFPGGNMDKSDQDFTHTALRETHEELGLDPAQFDVWGQMNSLPGSAGKKLVYPIIARTGEIDVDRLRINHHEVEEAFCVSLKHLCNHSNIRITHFRSVVGYTLPVYINSVHRIWGLTAAIIHQMLNIVAPELYTYKVKHRKPAHPRIESKHTVNKKASS